MRRMVFGLVLLASSLLLAQSPPVNERVSVASDGTQGNDESGGRQPTDAFANVCCSALSANGRFVVFSSLASNLVPGDTNQLCLSGSPCRSIEDVFLFDRKTRQISRISIATDGTQGNKNSEQATISADGRVIAFSSYATTLVPGVSDRWGRLDILNIFTLDRQTGLMSMSSVASDGTPASIYDPHGVPTTIHSEAPSLSADGRYVAFSSNASNLVLNDTNTWCTSACFPVYDIFVHDRQTGNTVRVSVASDGTQSDGQSRTPTISSDGRFVVFESEATNLVLNDHNGADDIFLHDRDADGNGTFDEVGPGKTETRRISVTVDGIEANGRSESPRISADGHYVAFATMALNLLPGFASVGDVEIVLKDTRTGVVTVFPVGNSSDPHMRRYSQSGTPGISADGSFVACIGHDSTVTRSTDPLYLWIWNRNTNQVSRLPYAYDGGTPDAGVHESGLWGLLDNLISGDGQFMIFSSAATNLVAGDTNGKYDVFVTANPLWTDIIPPTAPTNLAALLVDVSSIKLTWQASTDNVGVTGYKIYRNGSFLKNAGNVVGYSDTSLPAAIVCSYQVSAVDAAGNESVRSNTASVTAPSSSVIPSPTSANLIRNPGFEIGIMGWTFTPIATLDRVVFHSGAYSAKMSSLTIGSGSLTNASAIGVTAGRSYLLSAWIKLASVLKRSLWSRGVELRVGWYNSSRLSIQTDRIVSDLEGSANWVQYRGNIVAPTGAATARVYLSFHRASGTAWFDDVSMTVR